METLTTAASLQTWNVSGLMWFESKVEELKTLSLLDGRAGSNSPFSVTIGLTVERHISTKPSNYRAAARSSTTANFAV